MGISVTDEPWLHIGSSAPAQKISAPPLPAMICSVDRQRRDWHINQLHLEQGSICSQVISRSARISHRENGAYVLVAGPPEQKIVDAKDQSAQHRKDARRQWRLAQYPIYLQWQSCCTSWGDQPIISCWHSRKWWASIYPNYKVRMASCNNEPSENFHSEYSKIFSKQSSKWRCSSWASIYQGTNYSKGPFRQGQSRSSWWEDRGK